MISSGAIVVSWDFSPKDKSIMLVGYQNNGVMNIVNEFYGKEAEELYLKLVPDNIRKVRLSND